MAQLTVESQECVYHLSDSALNPHRWHLAPREHTQRSRKRFSLIWGILAGSTKNHSYFSWFTTTQTNNFKNLSAGSDLKRIWPLQGFGHELGGKFSSLSLSAPPNTKIGAKGGCIGRVINPSLMLMVWPERAQVQTCFWSYLQVQK